MWVVMTSSAAMPASCRGRYRRVAVVQLTDEYAAANQLPAMISTRAKGVQRLIDLGHHSVGKTARCAYQRALREAEQKAKELNNEPV